MAKVSLRIYNREIERLVEQGQTDEAIAHCRHILRVFPKHLETYRLLGKAYLEARRYGEAVDIFGRLLMAVPDDFVAHVGLSIIRDEENKLDDAIWHMERAFEVQSSNPAIQGELQRLYGRRDGMEPPKVRMTRGALARIYVQGELYPQAIAEIRNLLAEDPQRADMQVLLAYAYFKSGQKSDTTDMCNQLLKRYAYTFDANRIMVDLLPSTTGSVESTQVYRMHVGEMDPYANFSTGSIFQTSEVPDASISLERLEYTGEEVPMRQDWNSASIAMGAVAPALGSSNVDEQPDWLKSVAFDEPAQTSAMPASESEASDEIPDFLRAAGWGESKTPERPTSFFDEEPAEGIVQADLPDWLKGQAPAEDQLKSTEPASTPLETPDWLTGLDSSSSSFDPFDGASTPSATSADWLNDLDEKPEQPSISDAAIAAGTVAAAAAASDVPDWLRGLESAPETPTEENSLSEAQPVDLPDWLTPSAPSSESVPASAESLGSSAQEQDDAIAWLESLAAKHGAKPEELVTDPNKRSETPPEWVAQAQNIGQESAPTPASAESLGSSAQEQDDAIAWLESLASKHGAKPEELVTDPNKRSETPPEWVAQAQSIGQESAAPTPVSAESLGSSAQEQDDAIAWLESLAAKHGAKPEELVTDPNKRSETPPEWVAQAQSIGQEPEPAKTEWSANAQNIGEEFFAEFEKGSDAPPASVDETGMWLRDLDKQEEQPATDASDIPDWMKPETEEEPLARGDIPDWLNETESMPQQQNDITAEQVVQNQDLSDWLSGLDDEPGLNIDPDVLRAPTQPTVAATSRPDLPDWLNDMETEKEEEDESWKQPIASPPAPEPVSLPSAAAVALSADLPDWLQSLDEEEVPEAAHDDDLAPWEHREQWEAEAVPQTPKPTSPSDWHPISEKGPVAEASPAPQPMSQPLAQNIPSPEPVEQPVAVSEKKKPVAKPQAARPKKAEAQTSVGMLGQAKAELDRGDIPEALSHYSKLIKKGKHLEEIIRDLTDSIYRYPVEVGIWQALGDAYMRANRLKEALDAYNKAEELIR
ncbi:MAG TPA: tetratricopeptide repeat protein [Anaerolineales bacterium]|nr:tetratricopeptide repeat protein [Anaerolineales bacterium]